MADDTESRQHLLKTVSRSLLYTAPFMVAAYGMAVPGDVQASGMSADYADTQLVAEAEAEAEGEAEGEAEAEAEGEAEAEAEAEAEGEGEGEAEGN